MSSPPPPRIADSGSPPPGAVARSADWDPNDVSRILQSALTVFIEDRSAFSLDRVWRKTVLLIAWSLPRASRTSANALRVEYWCVLRSASYLWVGKG